MMKTFSWSFGALAALSVFFIGSSSVYATGESVQVTNVFPTGAISASTTVTFSTATSGFIDPSYSVTDSFPGATSGSFDKIGNYTWTPKIYDAGRHTLTVLVSDTSAHAASTTVNILVASNTALIQSLSSASVAARKAITFSIIAPGFITPQYMVYDTYGFSSVNASNINLSGAFSWTPSIDEIGLHHLTIQVSDAAGHQAQVSQDITVFNPNVPAVATSTSPSVSTPSPSLIGTTSTPAPLTSSTSAANTSPKYVFTTLLAIGSHGAVVTELQKKLIALGYLTGSPTGYFGALTAAGVKKFQAAHGLATVGYVGVGTRAALNK